MTYLILWQSNSLELSIEPNKTIYIQTIKNPLFLLLIVVFYAPVIEDRGAYCFCPVCHSVFLSETLTLLITVEQWVLELWYFTWVFLVMGPFSGYHYFWPWPWSLTHFLKSLTLLIAFEQWELELWYFTWVFLVMRPFRGYHYFWPCDIELGVWPIFFHFYLFNYFLTESSWAFIF